MELSSISKIGVIGAGQMGQGIAQVAAAAGYAVVLSDVDEATAGRGKDRIRGGPGADRLFGQAGKDDLAGGKGRDRVRGGAGKDKEKP